MVTKGGNDLPTFHSFSNLSDDRSNASSKTVPPHSAFINMDFLGTSYLLQNKL